MEDREITQLSPLSPWYAKKYSFEMICSLKEVTERLAVIALI
jgi:hypothetical protein